MADAELRPIQQVRLIGGPASGDLIYVEKGCNRIVLPTSDQQVVVGVTDPEMRPTTGKATYIRAGRNEFVFSYRG